MSQAATTATAMELPAEPTGTDQVAQDGSDPQAPFWLPEGYRQVTVKYEDAANYLDQLHRMVTDRASLEKKIAKELNSFAKKWEGRMIKVNPFPQGSYQAVTMAGPHQARAAASMHLAVATKLHDEIGANLTAHGKSNYKRRLGRLGPLSEANKAFKEADGGFAKASKHTTKLRATKETKEQERQALADKRTIVVDMSTDGNKAGSLDKLQSALEKKEFELKKATDKYQEARVKSEAAFAKFVATMQARYNLVEEDLKARFEELQQLTVQAVEAMDFTKSSDDEDTMAQVLLAANAAAVTDDMSLLRTGLSVNQPPAHDATVATKAVHVKTKGDVALAGQGHTKGGWFQKRGEKANSKYKKRFFVLTPTALVYYQDLDTGVPTKKKGEVELSTMQSVAVSDAHLELRTPARTYFLIAETPEQADNWAATLTTQLNIPLEKMAAPAPPVVTDDDPHDTEDDGPTIDQQNAAATVIQSNFRGHKEHQRFQSKKQAAVTIQSHYRGHLARTAATAAAATSTEAEGAVDAADLAAAASLAMTSAVLGDDSSASAVAGSAVAPALATPAEGAPPASAAAVVDAIMPTSEPAPAGKESDS